MGLPETSFASGDQRNDTYGLGSHTFNYFPPSQAAGSFISVSGANVRSPSESPFAIGARERDKEKETQSDGKLRK